MQSLLRDAWFHSSSAWFHLPLQQPLDAWLAGPDETTEEGVYPAIEIESPITGKVCDTSMTSYVDDIAKMYVCRAGSFLAEWVKRGGEQLQQHLDRHL